MVDLRYFKPVEQAHVPQYVGAPIRELAYASDVLRQRSEKAIEDRSSLERSLYALESEIAPVDLDTYDATVAYTNRRLRKLAESGRPTWEMGRTVGALRTELVPKLRGLQRRGAAYNGALQQLKGTYKDARDFQLRKAAYEKAFRDDPDNIPDLAFASPVDYAKQITEAVEKIDPLIMDELARTAGGNRVYGKGITRERIEAVIAGQISPEARAYLMENEQLADPSLSDEQAWAKVLEERISPLVSTAVAQKAGVASFDKVILKPEPSYNQYHGITEKKDASDAYDILLSPTNTPALRSQSLGDRKAELSSLVASGRASASHISELRTLESIDREAERRAREVLRQKRIDPDREVPFREPVGLGMQGGFVPRTKAATLSPLLKEKANQLEQMTASFEALSATIPNSKEFGNARDQINTHFRTNPGAFTVYDGNGDIIEPKDVPGRKISDIELVNGVNGVTFPTTDEKGNQVFVVPNDTRGSGVFLERMFARTSGSDMEARAQTAAIITSPKFQLLQIEGAEVPYLDARGQNLFGEGAVWKNVGGGVIELVDGATGQPVPYTYKSGETGRISVTDPDQIHIYARRQLGLE